MTALLAPVAKPSLSHLNQTEPTFVRGQPHSSATSTLLFLFSLFISQCSRPWEWRRVEALVLDSARSAFLSHLPGRRQQRTAVTPRVRQCFPLHAPSSSTYTPSTSYLVQTDRYLVPKYMQHFVSDAARVTVTICSVHAKNRYLQKATYDGCRSMVLCLYQL